jgi:predicted kinase
MRIYLKAFVLNLAKNNEEIKKSSFIPKRLAQIEREMKAGTIVTDDVMKRLRDEEKFEKAFNDGDWKMIEREVNKMIK